MTKRHRTPLVKQPWTPKNRGKNALGGIFNIKDDTTIIKGLMKR